MSEPGRLFLEACGASGSWQLEWRDGADAELQRREFPQPAVLVGRNPRAEIALDHPDVSKRHAYFQVIEGRLFAVDLESRDGLRWGGVPRQAGWVDRDRPIEVGPVSMRLVAGASALGDDPGAGPGPTSPRFAGQHPLPGASLEFRGVQGEPRRWGLDRMITLVGSSPQCPVRLFEPGTSRFACALVWTPKGVWLVDLLSSQGLSVNGVPCRGGRLEDGDTIRVGCQEIALTYDGTPSRPGAAANDRSALPAPLGGDSQEAWELVPDLVLGRLAGRDATPMPPGLAAAPRDQALMLMVRLLGEIHRDHLGVVREEMEQIRRLNRELSTLRGAASLPSNAAAAVAVPPPAPTSLPPAREPVAADLAPGDRPAPHAVHARVGERLAAWEQERQSRWRKVMDLLVKP